MARLDTIRKEKIRSQFLTGSYPKELVPQTLDIPDYIQQVDLIKETKIIEQKMDNKISMGQPRAITEIPVPLTEQEAIVTDKRIKDGINRIRATRARLTATRETISKRIADQTNDSISFAIDFKKKPRILRAIKKLWGEKRNEITFEMYKELLEAKRFLEKAEIEEYASGKIRG